jgi:hypothetical protein
MVLGYARKTAKVGYRLHNWSEYNDMLLHSHLNQAEVWAVTNSQLYQSKG